MSLSAAEKLEVIRLVEESELPVKRTLAELGVSRSSFYRWYRQYLDDGPEGLEPASRSPRRFWNKLPETVKEQCLDIALQFPDKSPGNWPGLSPMNTVTSSRNPASIAC